MHLSQWRPSLAALVVAALVGALIPPFAGSAVAQAQAPHSDSARRRDEVPSLRTKYSKTFYEGNGIFTEEISTVPVHFKGQDDTWKEIDNTLVPCEDVSCGWRNRSGDMQVSFAPTANDTGIVEVEDDGRALAFGLLNSRDLSTPVVEENSITYKDVLPALDLRYEVTATQVKELIILNEVPRTSSVTFPLRLEGLRAVQRASGEIELLNEADEVQFTLPRLWMEDSAGQQTDEPAYSEAVDMKLENRGQAQFITVSADEQWLTDPARVYPVKIDPIVSNTASRDTFIVSGSSTDNRASTELRIGTFDGGATKRRALVDFPMSNFIGSNRVIRNARMRLWNSFSGTCGAAHADVHPINQGWSADTVTWANQPTFDPSVASNSQSFAGPTCPAAGAIEYPNASPPLPPNCWTPPQIDSMTQIVRNWANGSPSYGFMVKANRESVTDDRKTFNSSEAAAHPPTLLVSYTTPPQAPSQFQPAGSTTNTRPTLSAFYDDPDMENGTKDDWGCIEFEIWRADGGDTVQTGWSGMTEPEQRGSWQVGPNALRPGMYYWHARSFDEWIYTPARPYWSAQQTLVIEAPPPLPAPNPPWVSGPSPASPSNQNSVSWTFSSGGGGGGGFQCKLLFNGTGGDFGPCTSGQSWPVFNPGTYNLEVREANTEGLWSTPTTSPPYVLDESAPPEPSITSSPRTPWDNPNPVWVFASGGGDSASFLCRITRSDGSEYRSPKSCSASPSSTTFNITDDGTFHFEVKARDAAGNESTFVRSGPYVLDTQVAAPAITSSPSSPSSNTRPSWGFTGEAGASFQCQFGLQTAPSTADADWTSCTSPYSPDLAGKNGGTYSFWVRQTDPAGNRSQPSVKSSYIFDAGEPGAPRIWSSTHPRNSDDTTAWFNNDDPLFSWEVDPLPPSGIRGYSYLLDRSPNTVPPVKDPPQPGPPVDPPLNNVAEGISWFHVRAQNGVKTWGTTAGHFEIRVDVTSPSAPIATSKSHVPGVAFKNNRIAVSWTPASDDSAAEDVSGVAEYLYAFRLEGNNGDRGAPADGVCAVPSDCRTDASTLSAVSKPLPDGRYWFHVSALDHAGNITEVSDGKPYGPLVIDQDGASVPLAPTLTDALVAQSDTNGLEQFYPYRSMSLGTAEALVNLHSGNLVVRQQDAVVPGVGLDSVIRHTYNSQRDVADYHDTGVGQGWSLSLSDATTGLDGAGGATGIDLNTPLLSTVADVVAGAAGQILELTDGDGTTHRFVKDGLTGSRWESPPGVNLRVHEIKNGVEVTRYELFRPDGVRYVVEPVAFSAIHKEWRVVAIEDRNGNELTLTYGAYEPTGTRLFKGRLETVTHNRFPDQRVALFTYFADGKLDKIETLPGLASRVIDFTIDDQHRLTAVTENAGVSIADGQRTTRFDYTPYDPDNNELTQNEVPLLSSVTDARGSSTTFDYVRQSGSFRLKSIEDRRSNVWRYSYDVDTTSGEMVTIEKNPSLAPTTYRSSSRGPVSGSDPRLAGGNIRRITDAGNNAGGVINRYDWTENRLVSKTDGVDATTTMRYDHLGLLTRLESPPPNTPGAGHLHQDAAQSPIVTTFSYAYSSPYPDGSSNCTDPTEQEDCSVGDISKQVVGQGMGKQESVVDFGYDPSGVNLTDIYERINTSLQPDNGRLQDDVQRHTHFDYYSSGLLKQIDGPRSGADVTLFGDGSGDRYGGYHRSGSPHQIKDADGKAKEFKYNDYGAVTEIKDRYGRKRVLEYDERDNLKRSTDLWASLESPADDRTTSFTFDPNDNLITSTSPKGSATSITTNDFKTTYVYNAMDQRAEVRRPGVLDPGTPRITSYDYDADGSRKWVDGPLPGEGDRTTFTYWDNETLRVVTAPAATGNPALTRYFYDRAGRVQRIQYPTVAVTGDPPEQTITYTPQGTPAIIRATSMSGLGDRVTKASYDAQGRLIELLGPRKLQGNEQIEQAQQQVYDSFGQLRWLRTRVDANKWLEYGYSYDPAGNVIEVSQPAGSGPSDELVSKYSYDKLNRLDEQTQDPFNPNHTVDYSYLPEGQQAARIDYYDPDGAGPLNKNKQREITHSYNPDYSVQSMTASDKSGTLTQCNFPADASDLTSGYDRDGNLLETRTVKGAAGCSATDTVARQTFEYNNAGFMDATSQSIDLPGPTPLVKRTQTFTYQDDGSLQEHIFDGRKTTYGHSPAGWMEAATDWRSGAAASSFKYFPSGATREMNLGGGVAKAASLYHPDGSLRSLVWTNAAQTEVRAHRSLTYDEGGLWTGETVSILPASGDTKVDSGGSATFGYDLAGRLTSWKSPFRLDPERGTTDDSHTEYKLDDAGNVKDEFTTVGGSVKREINATYRHGRLVSRTLKTFGLALAGQNTTTEQTFEYTPLGEEEARHSTTRVADDPLNRTTKLDTTTAFDPRGFTSSFDETQSQTGGTTTTKNLDYVYDADGRVIARTGAAGGTRLYFYFAGSRQLMEETSDTGASKIRYFIGSSGQPLAEHRLGGPTGDAWVWLLRDAKGSVGTELKNDGTIVGQKSYDPYGATDAAGTSKTAGERHSTLGFQAAHTDDVSGRILLGERQYDPTTERFTTPDVYVGSASDLELGTDPLTGNRYVFAASNPVSLYDDGHRVPCEGDCSPQARRRLGRQSAQGYGGTSTSSTSSHVEASPAYDVLDGWATYHYAALRWAARQYGRYSATAAQWASKTAGGLRTVSQAFLWGTGYISAVEKWYEDADRPDLNNGQRMFRSVVTGGGAMFGSAFGAGAGLLICTPAAALACSPGLGYLGGKEGVRVANIGLNALDQSVLGTPDLFAVPVTGVPLVQTLRSLIGSL